MQGILWAVILDPTVLAEVASRYPVEQRHHITLQYGVEEAKWAEWIGQEFIAVAVEECWNDHIQALRIELPPHIPCNNLHPHITLSHQPDIEPKAANEMLDSSHQSQLLWIPIPVRIEFIPKPTLPA